MEIGRPWEIVPESSDELAKEYQGFCEEDVKKFRTLWIDLSPDQKRIVETKFKEIFLSELKGPISKLWGSVLVQMFDLRFPILPIEFGTVKEIFNTPGHTFYIPPALEAPPQDVAAAVPLQLASAPATPAVVTIPQSESKPEQTAPISPFPSTSPLTPLWVTLDRATKAAYISKKFLRDFHKAAQYASPDEKTVLLSKFIEVGNPRTIFLRPAERIEMGAMARPQEKHVVEFRKLAGDLNADQKELIKAKFREVYSSDNQHSNDNPAGIRWGGVVGQMLDPEPAIIPIGLQTIGEINSTPGNTFFQRPEPEQRSAPPSRQNSDSKLSALRRLWR